MQPALPTGTVGASKPEVTDAQLARRAQLEQQYGQPLDMASFSAAALWQVSTTPPVSNMQVPEAAVNRLRGPHRPRGARLKRGAHPQAMSTSASAPQFALLPAQA